MNINGFHHLAVKCRDLDRSIEFYKAFGMTVDYAWGEGNERICLVHLGNRNYLELFAGGSEEEKPESALIHVALRVDDAQAAFDLAVRLGAPVVKPVTRLVIQSKPDPIPVILAFVKGPDGVVLEFFQTL